MNRVFVDTNIVLDFLIYRPEFFEESRQLFSLADQGVIKLYISSMSIVNSNYMLERSTKSIDVRKVLGKFKVLVNVLPLVDKYIDLAISSEFKDFEDAIQYYTAIENEMDVILTRNKKDFKLSTLPVLTAKEFLQII
ncbi:MAG: tRNA(fMet)-specific endonuclease VapC [Bacteroidota bacterium]|jgi:predicted nucleic acid-binding protein